MHNVEGHNGEWAAFIGGELRICWSSCWIFWRIN